jgi:hypothetical protein
MKFFMLKNDLILKPIEYILYIKYSSKKKHLVIRKFYLFKSHCKNGKSFTANKEYLW